MASLNKLRKTNKKHHWGRGACEWLKQKNKHKVRGVTIFNASMRQVLKKINIDDEYFQ